MAWHDERIWLTYEISSKVNKRVEKVRRFDRFMLETHVPTAVAPFIPSRFDLDRTKTISDLICDDDICVRYTHRCQGSDEAPSKQLAHDIVFAGSAEDRGVRSHE